jgi:hypothetical protein
MPDHLRKSLAGPVAVPAVFTIAAIAGVLAM